MAGRRHASPRIIKPTVCFGVVLVFLWAFTGCTVPPVLFDVEADMFPASWDHPSILARGKSLVPAERQRSSRLVRRALKKYPASLVQETLQRVYVLQVLEYRGIRAGGTNSSKRIYLANQGINKGYTDSNMELTFHSEFSSVLLRKFGDRWDAEAWRKLNPPGFSYVGSGVEAIKSNKMSRRFDVDLFRNGFLYIYATSTLENDFNAFAGHLFMGDRELWRALENHPVLRAKADRVMQFYKSLHLRFNEPYFRNIASQNAQSVAPSGDSG